MLDSADLQRLLRATPGTFVLLRPDAAFTIIAASDDYLRTSHTDESILGRPLFDVFPDNPALDDPEGSRTLRASLARVIATRLPDRMPLVRYDVRDPAADDGTFVERYWFPQNIPVLDRDGRIDFIVHRVEEATAKAHHRAVEILESITEGFFTLDRQWRFDDVNAEAHRILGVEPGSLARRVIWEVYPGLEDTSFWHCYHQTMDERVKTSFTAHYDQQARWYEVTVFPAPEGISIYFRNVTERKLLEAQREALADLSQRLGSAFDAARAGHDGALALGTVLNASRVGYDTVDHEQRREVHAQRRQAGPVAGTRGRLCAGACARQRHRAACRHARARVQHVRAGRPLLRAAQRRPGHRADAGEAAGRGPGRQRPRRQRRPRRRQRVQRPPAARVIRRRARHGAVPRGPGHRAGPPSRRILIADDNEDAAESLAMFLDMAGHETRIAADGAQAIAIAREFRPHAVVLDIAMPILDGLEAARAIRALAEGPGMLLLALSGFGQDADRQRSLDAGFDDHLVKPVDLARIEKIIDTNLGHGLDRLG